MKNNKKISNNKKINPLLYPIVGVKFILNSGLSILKYSLYGLMLPYSIIKKSKENKEIMKKLDDLNETMNNSSINFENLSELDQDKVEMINEIDSKKIESINNIEKSNIDLVNSIDQDKIDAINNIDQEKIDYINQTEINNGNDILNDENLEKLDILNGIDKDKLEQINETNLSNNDFLSEDNLEKLNLLNSIDKEKLDLINNLNEQKININDNYSDINENSKEKPKINTNIQSLYGDNELLDEYTKFDEKINEFLLNKHNKELERQARLEKRKHDRDNSVYVNDKVSIEVPTFKDKLRQSLSGVGLIFGKFNNKFKNNIFSKNKRNKKDMNRQVLLIDFEGEDAKKSDKKLLYEYVAKDKNGKYVKDYFSAYSKVEVHSFLLSEGYEVYSIKTNSLIQLLHKNQDTNKAKFKNKDLIFFLTQLSTYIKAGIPLVDSLRIISRQYKKKSYQKIFRSVIYELTIGENFSEAMLKQNTAFPKLLINMVKTAEMTGSLPEVLDDMAEYYTEAEATRKEMVTALTYPTLVFTFAIGVMVFIMVYVVPKFVEIYDTMEGTSLPAITQIILTLSEIMQKYWYLLLLGVVILIVSLIFSYKKIKSFRTGCQWFMMHIPVIKNTIIYNEVTMFTKTFSSLLAHNVPITDCMDILNKITNNEIYKMLILDTIANLARGGKISDAFKDNWAFPVPAYEMIVTGEMTGELSEMMGKVSSYYQDLHKNSVTRIKTFIEPALTIFLTFGVGIIILSIIVPMFGMYSAVQNMG